MARLDRGGVLPDRDERPDRDLAGILYVLPGRGVERFPGEHLRGDRGHRIRLVRAEALDRQKVYQLTIKNKHTFSSK